MTKLGRMALMILGSGAIVLTAFVIRRALQIWA